MQENTRNTDDSSCSGTKRLFTSWLLFFRHEERERHNFYYADCSYIAHSHLSSWNARSSDKSQLRPNKCFTHPIAPSWTGLAQSQISTNSPNKRAAYPVAPNWPGLAQSQILTNVFFEITKFLAHRFRTWCHSHPRSISSLGFLLWPLWSPYPLRTSVKCTQCMHLHVH